MSELTTLLTGFIALVSIAGIGAQWLAWRFHLPAVLLLALAGLMLGPVLDLLRPGEQLGPMLTPLVGLSVAIILFEGGMNLRIHELGEAGRGVARLTTICVAVTWLLGSIAAHYVGALSWRVAVLFGAIIIVTGPTVIVPMLRQAKLQRRPASLLKWEGIINDPVGALLAVLTFEYFRYAGTGAEIPQVLGGLAGAIVAALVLGGGGGYVLGKLFVRDAVPEFLKAPVTLATIIVCYVLANRIQSEAGLLAATLLGMTLGNMRVRSIEELKRLKEYVSLILVSAIFVILTADIDPRILGQLDWHSAGLLALVVFVIRPAAVMLSTVRLDMAWQDRVLLAWIAPRGVVAVTIAGVFATRMSEHGYSDTTSLLLPLVVALVLITVALHGSTIGWLARRLGLAATNQNGILLVGASDWSMELAIQLREMNIPVMIADSNWYALSHARLSGIRTHYGEILSEDSEVSLELNDMGFLLAATANDAYNALVCSRFAPEFGRNHVFQLPMHIAAEDKEKKGIKYAHRGVTAFGPEATTDELQRRHYYGWQFKRTRFTREYTYEDHMQDELAEAVLLLLLRPDGSVLINSDRFPLKPAEGDVLLSYAPPLPDKI